MRHKQVRSASIDGTPVIIYNTEAGGDYPIHGAYLFDGNWYLSCWTRNGKRFITEDMEPHPLDLPEAYLN